ncbi:hypothetical protein [Paraburkholderia sp.]|uniref:hypothetical protein n=1 Tax=Paraburkholderia sp. TaxID=1926495 RepID=UPI0025EB13FE|nr:hypothetical protein [Paraburkholderia sp.]
MLIVASLGGGKVAGGVSFVPEASSASATLHPRLKSAKTPVMTPATAFTPDL